MQIRTYNIIDNGEETMLAVNVFDKKENESILFLRNDNDLIIKISGVCKYCFRDIPYQVWSNINSGKCFMVEFGPIGAINEYDVILS